MLRLYSPEWVAAFNEAVRDLDLTALDTGASLVASSGRFRLAQVVQGGPDGDVRMVLEVDDGTVHLQRDESGDVDVDVTIVLSYDDAVVLSRGETSPAQLLGTGRVKVRGDLSVLLAGQAVLAAAAGRLGVLADVTAY